MNLANRITFIRILMIPLFLIVLIGNIFGEYSRIISAVIFVLASLTDFLDGYIARSRNMVTNLGKFMDPLADKLLISAALIAMIELGDLTAWVVIVMISREFIITGFRVIAADKDVVLAACPSAKLKTATQMIMVVYVLLGISMSSVTVTIKYILIGLSVILSIYSAVEYIVKNKEVLY